jgi:hypothetical protein
MAHTFHDARGTWQVETLWAASADVPIEMVPTDTLRHHLDTPCWEAEPMTPAEVVSHAQRILNADLNYPILLSQYGHIMDGVHRLCKAVLYGHPYVQVRRFTLDPPPDAP